MSPRAVRTSIAAGGIALLIVIAGITLRAVASASGSCQGGISVTVAAAPEIAPAVAEAAGRWMESKPEISGTCVQVRVAATDPATVAAIIAARAGARFDTGTGETPAADLPLPQVWIPDSGLWLRRVQPAAHNAFNDDPVSIAMSPVVLAMPKAAAQALGWPGGGAAKPVALADLLAGIGKPDTAVRLAVADPRRDATSLASLITMGELAAGPNADLTKVVVVDRLIGRAPTAADLLKGFSQGLTGAPLSEHAVIDYDATHADSALAAVQVQPGAASLDYPYTPLAGQEAKVNRAVAAFKRALVDNEFRDAFTRHGFRSPDGSVGTNFPTGNGVTGDPAPVIGIPEEDKVRQALGVWTESTTPSRVLAIADISAASGRPLGPADAGGTQRIRLDLMRDAATRGVDLFTDDSELGLWAYAAGLDNGKDFRSAVPVATLGPPGAKQREAIKATLRGMAPTTIDSAGLYDTAVAAYRTVRDGYAAGHRNAIVLFACGRNNDPQSDFKDLDRVQRELERLVDPNKPIRVVLIGIGPDVDMNELNGIAAVTGGQAFQLNTPEDIQQVFLKSLLLPSVTQ